MTNYRITRAYDDNTCAQETTSDIVAALEAAAIYLRDESCWKLMIEQLNTLRYPNEKDNFTITATIFDYYRPA